MQRKIGDEQSKWENGIIRDLDYIKTNKRYRWTTKISTPLIVYGMLFLLTMSLLIVTIKAADSKMFPRILLPVVAFFLYGLMIFRYLQSLKFMDLATGLNKQQNYDLLISFLNNKGLLVYHHPQTNDVLQIVSRPLSLQDERREVLVFIINENTILINSHFTDSGWRLTAAPKHDKQIGAELMQWMLPYKDQNESVVKYN